MNAPESEAHKLVGAVFNGRYRLTRLLGEGGMGAVYEAEGTRGEGRRALKVLHREFVQEEHIRSRFFAEAETTRNLVHPNIARVEGVATAEDGSPYLVMELLVGNSLGTLLDRRSILPVRETVPIIQGVLAALGHAHAQRVVHRDLKPDNVFLVPDGRGGQMAKVLDFGIAKVMDLAGGLGQKTRTGMLLGTPGYMGPEQIKNAKGVDARSDLWSVAVMFYEMLTARMPFHAETEFARLTAVLTEAMTPIEQLRPELAAWSGFFQRALMKDPAGRFQSADEMARAVYGIAQATGGLPGPISHASPGVPSTAPAQPTSPLPSAPQPMPTVSQPAPMASPPAPMVPQPLPIAQSQPPPGYPAAPAGAPYAPPGPTLSAAGGPIVTHVSGQRPAGLPGMAPSQMSPQIAVIDAPPLPRTAPYWVVGVVGFVCLGLGFVIGFLVSAG